MFRQTWGFVLLFALALAPSGARGQCGMMGGGGHDHGSESAQKKSPSEKKVRQTVQQALADEAARQVLLEEILADPEFVQALTARIAAAPAGRALMEKSLAETAVATTRPAAPATPAIAPPSDAARAAAPPPVPAAAAAVYRCPMHSDVIAHAPGKCPKCGMDLRRDA